MLHSDVDDKTWNEVGGNANLHLSKGATYQFHAALHGRDLPWDVDYVYFVDNRVRDNFGPYPNHGDQPGSGALIWSVFSDNFDETVSPGTTVQDGVLTIDANETCACIYVQVVYEGVNSAGQTYYAYGGSSGQYYIWID
jgi:hypothetical protein